MGGFEGQSEACRLQGLLGMGVVKPVCRSLACWPVTGATMGKVAVSILLRNYVREKAEGRLPGKNTE